MKAIILDKQTDATEEDCLVQCECCANWYPYHDEPTEVQEGGTHICAQCWTREE